MGRLRWIPSPLRLKWRSKLRWKSKKREWQWRKATMKIGLFEKLTSSSIPLLSMTILRPCWRPYELDERCEEVRVKPVSAEVELDLSVDVDSSNYDTDARGLTMTKQTLSSSWKPPRTTGYAVGILMGNKLHLNPIRAVVQLRPSMQHLKYGDLNKKNNAGNVEGSLKSEDPNGEPVGPPKKQSKPRGISNEHNVEVAESKLKGISNEHAVEVAESFVPLKYHGSKSDFSAKYLEKMVAEESSSIQFSMSPHDYMNSLCPNTISDSRSKGPLRRLLSLPLEERFKKWLCEGPPVHRFNALKHLAPDESIEDVLRVLGRHARLVQGLWVPKSSLLSDGREGVEALARDYILLLFSKNPTIKYPQLDVLKRNKALKGILTTLAVERPSFKDWKFREPTDVSFIKLYPNVVNEQNQYWEALEKKVTVVIHGGERSGPGAKNKPGMPTKPGTSTVSDKGAMRSGNETPSRRTAMSNETREALSRALKKLFQMYRVCSFQLICQGLRDLAVSQSTLPKADARAAVAAASAVDGPKEELQAVIDLVATNVHGVYVWKSSLEHAEYNLFRNVVVSLFLAKGPNAKLKKADIMEAAKIELKRDITNNEYMKVLGELCVSRGAAWVLKSGDGNPK
ncbi:uncharacterized protein LOC131168607 isoform X2 [Malania oleifera]|uniref:uncharacterized protein LOC131168607 isoform X2 n=1 Tax=Malania oleifera TaxID=397392 RepID=UPI0025ADCA93|nr:uncharacterized protein LOC131168607 isoform X2 [Malania oleifera]